MMGCTAALSAVAINREINSWGRFGGGDPDEGLSARLSGAWREIGRDRFLSGEGCGARTCCICS